MDDNDELLDVFLQECQEHLATIETDLLEIEESGANASDELVNKVFRAAHSIKGGSGFFGMHKVKEVAHRSETVLDLIRSGELVATSEVVGLLLQAFDELGAMLQAPSNQDSFDITDLLEGLDQLAGATRESGDPEPDELLLLTPVGGMGIVPVMRSDVERASRTHLALYRVILDLVHDVDRLGRTVVDVFALVLRDGELIDCQVDYFACGTLDEPIGRELPVTLVLATTLTAEGLKALFVGADPVIHRLMGEGVESEAVEPAVQADAPQKSAAKAAPSQPVTPSPAKAKPSDELEELQAGRPNKSTREEEGGETLRVNVRLLETLMNLAGELVLSRNQLKAAVEREDENLLDAVNQRVNQVTGEFQDVIMQTRLQPVGVVFSKFPRLVRDLSRTLGKDVRLEIEGKDVALDRTMVEGLSDPLTHMVRNAVDHGLEMPEERTRNGKSPTGVIRIEARHEAGLVVLEIADDGKGLDPERIAQSAIDKGLADRAKVALMSDTEKQALIFLPGLSTAAKVSDISGRGVGMDVVKTNLSKLGGQVDIDSAVGRGSTFRIKLPLTLAIIPSLILSVENERFAVPQSNIEELLRLRADEVKSRIEVVGGTEVLLLRDKVLPVARLAELLGVLPTYVDPATGSKEVDRRLAGFDQRSPGRSSHEEIDPESLSQRLLSDRRQSKDSTLDIAILSTGSLSYALVVGTFHDTEEVVVKPLGRRLQHLREYSGATILGDGAVALILDTAGLAVKAGLTPVSGSKRAAQLAAESENRRLDEVQSLLLFHNGPRETCAMPLDLIQRIERVKPEQVEKLGTNLTLHYRGKLLPLVSLSQAAHLDSLEGVEDLAVLVSQVGGRDVGLLCSLPVDSIDTSVSIDRATLRRKGVTGSTILKDKTTLIVDLFELVDSMYPDWTMTDSGSAPVKQGKRQAKPVLLLAEDSEFFRAQVKKYLEHGGCEVLDAPDGEKAWALLEKNLDRVRLVVTDIEMPLLDGLGLAARIRANASTAHLPIIAVTSLAGEEDAARGYAAGITEYQVKLDRDRLLASVVTHLAAKPQEVVA